MGTYEGSKTKRYIDIIRTYVIGPLEQFEALRKSCFATTMLIFAAIDGLGALVHEQEKAKNSERFKGYLDRLGQNYKDRAEDLWKLRNNLMHTAMNVASFMSAAEETSQHHLSTCGDYLFVNSVTLIRDFKKALDELEAQLQRNEYGLLERAEGRLEECNYDPESLSTLGTGSRNLVPATTPPPVAHRGYVRSKVPVSCE